MRFRNGAVGFKKTRRNDLKKAAWAKANGYRLITIKYDQSVEKVLTRELSIGFKKAEQVGKILDDGCGLAVLILGVRLRRGRSLCEG